MNSHRELRALAARVPDDGLSARLEAEARRAESRDVLVDVLGVAIGAALVTFAAIAAFII